jgi:hypothetical protein
MVKQLKIYFHLLFYFLLITMFIYYCKIDGAVSVRDIV